MKNFISSINSKFKVIYSRLSIFFIAVIAIAYSIYGTNDYTNTNTSQDNQNSKIQSSYSNCSANVWVDDLDISPLQTNINKSKYNLFSQTQSAGFEKNQVVALSNLEYFPMTNALNCFNEQDVFVYVKMECDNLVVERAYPKKLLEKHLVVNENCGEDSFIVTYSPYSNSFGVYRTNDFMGNSGRLFSGINLMYDKTSESLWLQLNGEAVVGDKTGNILEQIPYELIRYSKIKKIYPEVLVPYFLNDYDYNENQYLGFDNSDYLPGVEFDFVGLSPKDKVVGVVIKNSAIAYDYNDLNEYVVIDEIDGNKYTVELNDLEASIKVSSEFNYFSNSAYLYSWLAVYPQTKIFQNNN